MQFSETTTRVLVAAVAIPVAIGIIYLGGWVLAAGLAVLAVLSAGEFYRLAETRQARPLVGAGMIAVVLFVLSAALASGEGPDGAGFGMITVVAMLVIGALAIWTRGVEGQPLLSVSVTLSGAVYTGATLSFVLFLRHLPGTDGVVHATTLVLVPIVLTWVSDTMAFFSGRAFGKHKLIPTVSPGKTVEGAIGSVVGTALFAVACGAFLNRFPSYNLPVGSAILLGILISVFAQVGDLVESVLKRDAGVKDSGTLLPGHGGALDRFDSLFFTLPLGYLFFRFLVGPFS
ncbi:MAG: phosphatidate cytidylyltransferase [Gemmatimonadota bacterium]|jgi:phosphatidate cytidylyltransferase|nr:phosphatidate cytidylyltransferase [Gemmatimonadota bacterium]